MTLDEFIEKFHICLSAEQLTAVKSVNNPTLLLAVPGSGKTTVLITRLGYMIYCCGIEPERILTVTYTVAATKDMQQRFAAVFGQKLAERLEFRTINGICAKIISFYGSCVGKKAYELITEEGYKTKLLSAIYVNLTKEYPTESDLKNLSMQITYIKNMMLNAEEIGKLGNELELPLLKIYQEYCAELRRQNRMDYDDQMVYALTMLKKTPNVLSHFQDIYQYFLVDEAQDTSKIQHQIIETLAGRYENLFMVGDEDQSIYGFRAAFPDALLSFEKNHPNAQVLLMEENFRSNANIVSAANQFIQKNEFRHKKSMRASKQAGMEIKEIVLKSRKAQYAYLLKTSENCAVQTAVLYRDNESMLPLLDLLERNNISYRIKNADLTFFSSKIVMDFIHIIQFATNPKDTEAFLQIYYKIGTYMNKAAAMEACRNSEKKDISVLDAAIGFGKLPNGTLRSIKSMQTHLQNLLSDPARQAVYRLVNYMGYGAYLEKAHINDSKLQILEALAANEKNIQGLVERLNELAVCIREKKSDPACNFILSTIHSSKGLEYDRVYLMDVADGIFPEHVITNRKNAKCEELEVYEEERRLFYVGTTRAKDMLNIFRFQDKSTFCDELLGKQVTDSKTRSVHAASPYSSTSLLKKSKTVKKAKRTITEAEYLDKLEEIKMSGHIRHRTYGNGNILSMSGDTIEVAFQSKKMICKVKFMMEHELID